MYFAYFYSLIYWTFQKTAFLISCLFRFDACEDQYKMLIKILEIWWLLYLINSVINYCQVFAQIIPQNSCPVYFKYTNGANGVEGQMVLKFRITDSDINVVFEGSIPELLVDVSYRNTKHVKRNNCEIFFRIFTEKSHW